MNIQLKTPNTPYFSNLDTGVLEVEITKAFIGPTFVTEDGETLSVIMRDTGFELLYMTKKDGPKRLSLKIGNIEEMRGNHA